jgi:hypothetical protein
LRELRNIPLLALFDILVVEAREHVLLVQLVELACLLRYLGEVFSDFVLHVEPSRRQQVHFNHGIAVVVPGAAGHEPLTLLGHTPAIAEAIGARSSMARLLLRVVRVRLAVGYEAVELRQRV